MLIEVSWGFPKIKGTFLGGVPIITTIVAFWSLYWGPSILGTFEGCCVTPKPVTRTMRESYDSHRVLNLNPET